MSNLYERIEQLCIKKGINVTAMCRDAGVNRGNLSDLKMGRQSGLSTKNATKIANYLGVSVEYLLGEEKTPASDSDRTINDDDIKFALFGDAEIDDELYEEVKAFARFAKERKEKRST